MRLILLIVALVLALVAAALAFGWFGADPDGADILGVLGLSLAAYYGSLLVGAVPTRDQ